LPEQKLELLQPSEGLGLGYTWCFRRSLSSHAEIAEGLEMLRGV